MSFAGHGCQGCKIKVETISGTNILGHHNFIQFHSNLAGI